MDWDPPYYDDDESNHETNDSEGTSDSDGFEFDDDDAAEPESSDQVEEGSQSSQIIDLIANEKASEVRNQIFQTLYSKVGERLDAMKADTRKIAMNPTED